MTDFDLLYRDSRGVIRRRPKCCGAGWGCSLVSGHSGYHYIIGPRLVRPAAEMTLELSFVHGPRDTTILVQRG